MHKKILLLSFASFFHHNCNPSAPITPRDLYNSLSTQITGLKKYGIHIGDMNQMINKNCLSKEIKKAQAINNTALLLEESRLKIFGRHLIHHFGQDAVFEFITTAEQYTINEQDILDHQFQKAFFNYYQSRHKPITLPQLATINPNRGNALLHYIAQLRDQQDPT
jgi:hypothetical protein